jgi:hypothetical protein
MDGTNGGTTFTDESATIKGSGSAKSFTVTSTTTSTSQSKFYGSSGSFDGTNSILTIANNADFSFGTTDFTVECWVYPTSFAGANGARMVMSQGGSAFNDASGWNLLITNTGTVGAYVRGGTAVSITSTNAVSINAWGHIALCKDANGTSLYINGILGAFSATSPGSVTSGSPFYIGRSQGGGGEYFGRYQGFMNDVRIYKGVAKYTGNFNPPSSTANATIAAGNDSLVDSPTNYGTDTGVGGTVRGNYATLNPLDKGSIVSLSNGNLDYSNTTTGSSVRCVSTIHVSSGKWYIEHTVNSTNTAVVVGIASTSEPASSNYIGSTAKSYGYAADGSKYTNGTGTSYGSTYGTAGDIIGVAFNADAGTLTFYKNGDSQGAAFTGIPVDSYYFGQGNGPQTYSGSFNFGQRAFAYPLSTYKSLCTQNLPAPLVTKSNTVMDAVLYTGNSGSQAITLPGGFSPDLVWLKSRSNAYYNHLIDTVRGSNKVIWSNLTDAEQTSGTEITSFNSDGFTLGSGTGVNGSGSTYVGWCWDAGSSTVSNTQGSITSQVRANATAGFSVMTYTGGGVDGSVGHGLGVAPKIYIVKNRSATSNWPVAYTIVDGSLDFMFLNLTSAAGNATQSVPTSTVINLQQSAGETTNGDNYVIYAFAPVVGYSSFGSYTTTGSADGPFIYTGFRPAFILFKSTSSGQDWVIYDAKRDAYNVVSQYLLANTSAAEATFINLDFLSNGFKLRSTGSLNAPGLTFIYAAFAEAPFNYSRAR